MFEHPISRRMARPEDVPFLVKLRRETMTPHLIASGVDLSEEEHLQRVLVHFEGAEILMQGSEPIGLLKIVRNGPNWELLQIQLCPFLQGRGFGTKILRQLISEAQAANANLRLSVLKANPARRVYERLGFAVTSANEHAFQMDHVPNDSVQAAEQLQDAASPRTFPDGDLQR